MCKRGRSGRRIMILQSPQDGDLATQSFDVCIAGAGPAGITLALALSAQGRRVVLLEAGGFEMSPVSQEFYTGENVGLDYYDPFVSRLRYFGGASNHWGGRCRPLDTQDFEERPGLPLSGWPIAKADLEPYAGAADAVLDLDPVTTVPEGPTRPADPDLKRIGYRHSPVKFNARYRDAIIADPNILLVLNANLVDLRLDDAGRRVTGAVVRGYDAGVAPVTVHAETFCLCLGGLENARFLLNADSQMPGGIGNGAGLVGRFFCEHPHFFIADVLFDDPRPMLAHYAVRPETAARDNLPNFATRLMNPRRSLPRETARSLICSTAFSRRLVRLVLGRGPNCDHGGLEEWWEARGIDNSTAPLQINSAQLLDPDSRVMLGDARDAFGQRQLVIDWRLGPQDYATMRTASEMMGRYLARAGIGRVKIRDWLMAENPVPPGPGREMPGGYHHMCTTRMSDDPATGVVDRDCRVHGIANLYLGGSSVFATPGHANPTYTIVQLALRLADHLATDPLIVRSETGDRT